MDASFFNGENRMINFTLSELIGVVVAICGCITGVAAVIAVIAALIKRLRSPNDIQNKRLDSAEDRLSNIEKRLDHGNSRFNKIEDGNRITQKALLALLSHGIDGNEIEGMRKAKEELQDYLLRQ